MSLNVETSVGWFVALGSLSILALSVGRWLGVGPTRRAWLGMVGGVLSLGLWGWLANEPAVALRAIPSGMLCYLEGTAAVPMFMLVIGIIWSRSVTVKQKRVAAFGSVIGGLFFLHSALWMLQPLHETTLANSIERRMVMQSTDYSCVPAACATVMNYMGLPTTEAEMARLTETRPMTGSTFIRAVDGLTDRLVGTNIKPELVDPTPEQLTVLPTPLITAIHPDSSSRFSHMVVVFGANDKKVWLGDPNVGLCTMPRVEFDSAYTGQAIIFSRDR